MTALTRIWQGFLHLTRTMTIGHLASGYAVAVILAVVGFNLFGISAMVMAPSGQMTAGAWIVAAIAFVLMSSAIIVFAVFTVTAVIRLVRSLAA